jgi:FKBP-type peptidyl-prolyl cis-trans isomerase FkpA
LLRRSASAFAFVLCLALFAAACGGNDDTPTTPTPPQGPASLVIEDLTVGTGAEATGGKLLVMNYVVYLYDPAGSGGRGTTVDQGTGYSYRQGVNAVIPGVEQGMAGMKAGGVRRLTIPPSLAYGATGSGAIQPNAWIVFDCQLVGVAD